MKLEIPQRYRLLFGEESHLWEPAPVEGFEHLYAIHPSGEVWSIKGEQFLNSGNCRGYRTVVLHNNGVRKSVYVHILVARAFIPNPEGKLQVNHINEIKSDNRIENLEWVTRTENRNHGTFTERQRWICTSRYKRKSR
jgi:hypothetical protein